ncbi:hypothetical protein [Burkholderia multivorans]|jgi:hypothetical protein|uniref:hypothetical protein n=1 Tax=Burkholderia multivorans TaxID=87883 RepID=UPI000A8EF570|nr:hypothetical protein [Burkholderia multivorans]MBJ9624630.1 hypothetical protein [Burkholderia multivorans]MBR7895088.1 hypothetical protein [Burkholderia multivorans]MBR7924482.1 hypothetical protein [Burkholderia multivorans]MBR8045382.1 hypothetical protein [Burkholderia multivorans]MBR8102642.1 hypothetical protein [Burkholderia multivorans]
MNALLDWAPPSRHGFDATRHRTVARREDCGGWHAAANENPHKMPNNPLSRQLSDM